MEWSIQPIVKTLPHWALPPIWQLKLNVDAVCVQANNLIGVGAVLRDHDGSVVASFTKKISASFSPHMAEAMAVQKSLILSMAHGLLADII